MSCSPVHKGHASDGWSGLREHHAYTVYGDGPRVVVLDLGLDRSLVSWLALRDCRMTILGGPATCRQVLDLGPELVVVAGRASHDEIIDLSVETVGMLRDVPLFAIGLGFELLVRACGGTLASSCGHHLGDVRVVDLETGRRFTSAQDHRLHATRQSLVRTPLTALQLSVDDQTVEAVSCQDRPAIAVHYHPALGEGPAGLLLERMLVRTGRPERRLSGHRMVTGGI